MTLAVLIVEGREPITNVLARTLQRRGHRVATATSAERALELPLPDVFVCESSLAGAGGLDLLSALKERGDQARMVLLLGEATVEECLRAIDLGVTKLLAKPFRLAELVRAVEDSRGLPPRSPAVAEDSRGAGPGQETSYPGTLASVARAIRDLCAFALRRGVPPSTRARIAGAAAEVLDNAIRHGRRAPGARVLVRAACEGRTFRLRVRDCGPGFDPERARCPEPGPAVTGLARAAALSETFRVRSAPGKGTEVELGFTISESGLCDAKLDLSEADYLPPRTARTLVETLLEGDDPEVEGVSPAIAVVLGRLLAGPEPRTRAPRRPERRAS